MMADPPLPGSPSFEYPDKGAYVQKMFARIAPRYDLMNRLMSAGLDGSWRKRAVARAQIQPGDRVLDLGAGTGDLGRAALHRTPQCRLVSADFTLEMMRSGKKKHPELEHFTGADAQRLPFPDRSFDVVLSAFLLRNVADLDAALQEQYRVLKPGGRLSALDTTRPRPGLFTPFVYLYMQRFIPFLGGLLTATRSAYVYMPTSSVNFLPAEDLFARIHAAGFERAGFTRLMFGTVAIHWGSRPA